MTIVVGDFVNYPRVGSGAFKVLELDEFLATIRVPGKGEMIVSLSECTLDLRASLQKRINDARDEILLQIELKDWYGAHLGSRDLARWLVDATISGDHYQICLINEALAEIHSSVKLDESFVDDCSPTSLAWTLNGIRDTGQLAQQRYPTPLSPSQRIKQDELH